LLVEKDIHKISAVTDQQQRQASKQVGFKRNVAFYFSRANYFALTFLLDQKFNRSKSCIGQKVNPKFNRQPVFYFCVRNVPATRLLEAWPKQQLRGALRVWRVWRVWRCSQAGVHNP
jgi:hypothetical protein